LETKPKIKENNPEFTQPAEKASWRSCFAAFILARSIVKDEADT
jgi:hypothetical protein